MMNKTELRMETCREIWMIWEKKDTAGPALEVMQEYENYIRAEALKDAANRAVLCWFESDPHEDPLNIAKRLRAAIYAGEVKE